MCSFSFTIFHCVGAVLGIYAFSLDIAVKVVKSINKFADFMKISSAGNLIGLVRNYVCASAQNGRGHGAIVVSSVCLLG